MTRTKKIIAAVAAFAAIGVAGLTIGTSPAEAKHKHHHHHKHFYFYKHYNPYVYSYYGYGNCYVKWTKYGKSYICF